MTRTSLYFCDEIIISRQWRKVHEYINTRRGAGKKGYQSNKYKSCLRSLLSIMKSSALSLALSIVVSISSAVPLLILRADNSSSEIGSFISEESSTSAKRMVANIDPEGAATGFIAASPSKSNPVSLRKISKPIY